MLCLTYLEYGERLRVAPLFEFSVRSSMPVCFIETAGISHPSVCGSCRATLSSSYIRAGANDILIKGDHDEDDNDATEEGRRWW